MSEANVEEENTSSEDSEAEFSKELLRDEDWLREQYEEKGLSQTEIGELVGVTPSAVNHHFTKFGISARQQYTVDERLDDPEFLQQAYHGDLIVEGGASMQQIADECGCSDGTVMRRLHQNDIETRASGQGSGSSGPDHFEITRSVEGVGDAKINALKERGLESDEDVAELEVMSDPEDEDASLGLAETYGWSQELAESVLEQLEIGEPVEKEESEEE